MNEDFLDLLTVFHELGVDFVVIGAHAMALHGVVRATGDLDVFVRPSTENAQRLFQALFAFGAPIAAHGLKLEDFAKTGTIYQMGLPPRRIDVLTAISGLEFEEVWAKRVYTKISDLQVPFMSQEDLVINKRASGRTKDLLDIALMEEAGILMIKEDS